MNRKETHAQWKKFLEEYAKGDTTIKSFCEQKGVSVAQFQYYRQRLNKSCANGETLAPVKLQSLIKTTPVESSTIRLTLQNGMQCAIPCDMDLHRIQQLVEVLLSC